MEEKISMWELDTTTKISDDLACLGIIAAIHAPHGIIIHFKSDEDMNLYKIAGKFKENYYLMFLGPNDKLENVNLNTVISPGKAVYGH